MCFDIIAPVKNATDDTGDLDIEERFQMVARIEVKDCVQQKKLI